MPDKISVVIPCRNEEKFIKKCLDSVVSQNYPKENLEVLVVDGASQDRTREIIQRYSENYPFIKLLYNPRKFVPIALNIGIKNSQGDIIVRMDSHAVYDKEYISKSVYYLKKYNADNAGGPVKTVPFKKTLMAEAIALALSHPFGVGGACFRKGVKKVREADTVFGGCFRKEIFEKIGFFNENLTSGSEDMEFNLRLKKQGGKIILAPDIISYYYPKSDLKSFFFHNIRDGVWAILPLKFVKMPLRLRHYIPLVFVLTLPLSFWPYILVSFYFSLRIAIAERTFSYLFIMPLVFAARHIGYGLGSLWGLVRLLF